MPAVWFRSIQATKSYLKLKREKRYYQKEIRKTKAELQDLFSDEQSIEKFAREHYFMKKDSEDVWILTDTSATSLSHWINRS